MNGHCIAIVTLAIACAGCGSTPKDPRRSQQLVQAGRVLRAQGDYLGASQSFAAALKNDPDNAEAHLELGVEMLRAGVRLDEAIEHFREARRLDPSQWQAEFHTVDALRLKGDISGALDVQRKLAEELPDRPEIHCNLGDLLLREKRWAEAAPCFRRALDLQSDYPLAWCGLGIALWRGGHVEEGIAALRKAVAGLPERDLARLELARALLAGGEADEAYAEAEAVRKLEPRSGLVYHVLAEIRVVQGRTADARELAQKAVALGCSLAPELRDNLGVLEPESREGVRE